MQPEDRFVGYHGTTYAALVTILGMGRKQMPTPLKLGNGGESVSYRKADHPTDEMAYASSFNCAKQYACNKYSQFVQHVVVLCVVSKERKRSKKRKSKSGDHDYLMTNALATEVFIKKSM